MAAFPEVPGYELQAELGRGGMAIVYSAIETNLGRYVAIKVVTASAELMEGQIERLENEARGLATLHHPHIVDLYRFGRTADGALYYVMPLLPGGSLEDMAKPLPEARVIALLEHVLDALAHAHASDIIHRDIKPANILFDQYDRPMLADFGAAFMRGRSTRLTSQGIAIGSSGYMSPEQARGQDVDARSDLYSTAVLAFELLTGARPFEGPDDLSIAIAQTEKPVPRMPEALKHWQSFFYRALAVNPDHRYPNTAAMRTAIRSLSAPKAPRSNGLMIALAAGVVLLGVLAFAKWKPEATKAPPVRAEVAAPQPRIDSAEAPTEAPAKVAAETPTETLKPEPSPPAVGDRFSDEGGPELVLARLAKGSRPALAVMAAPVDATLYARYAKDKGRTPISCAGAPSPAQGCLDLATANDLAHWLGKKTDERYRVPTRTELSASMPQVAVASAQAWTSTCNEVRVARPAGNVAKRTWSRIRKAVGKPKAVQYDVRCEGNFTLKLDGRGNSAKAQEQSTPATVVVLVRDLAAGEPRSDAKE